MSKRKKILELITYQPKPVKEGFTLKETPKEKMKADSAGGDVKEERPPGRKTLRKLFRSGERQEKDEQTGAAQDAVHVSLSRNKDAVSELYNLPLNSDVVLREFVIGIKPEINCFAIFIDGLADRAIQDMLFEALMLFADKPLPKDISELATHVKKHLLPGNQIVLKELFSDVVTAVNMGDTAIFMEGSTSALIVDTKGWEHRGVERPQNEQSIHGPQESFTEILRVNTALIRKIIRNEKLTTEMMTLGERTKTNVAIMYLRDLANPELVKEVKRRLNSIKADYIAESGILAEYIEDQPYALHPTIMNTERPDRVAFKLNEGRVAIIIDGSPLVLVVPTTLYEHLHTAEESYIRWQYGSFLRYLRALAFLLSFLLPGVYLSIVLYHHEMLPTELLLSIAGNREKVPFPSVIELLLMLVSFELIREAGIRLPGVIGSTIGIVGALVLGQASVAANIVSPILVILVAITGLASYAIPSYSLSFALRIYCFIYIALGVTLGFFGIAIGIFSQIILTASLKSFGVPYLSPVGPRTTEGFDLVYRLPAFLHKRRPDYLNSQDLIRQPQEARGWTKDKSGGSDE